MSKNHDKEIVAEPAVNTYHVVAADKALTESLCKIEQLYSLPDANRIREFIIAHQQLADLLIEAYPLIEKHFGLGTEVVLEVFVDPEEEDFVELFGNIRTSLSPEAALEQLDKFDEEWFLDQIEKTDGKLNFNIEFI
jgi:hypothetical protein